MIPSRGILILSNTVPKVNEREKSYSNRLEKDRRKWGSDILHEKRHVRRYGNMEPFYAINDQRY